MAQSKKVSDALAKLNKFKVKKVEAAESEAVATAERKSDTKKEAAKIKSEKPKSKPKPIEVVKPDIVFAYDTETTGLPNWKVPSDSEEQPHLVQLAAILYDVLNQKVLDHMDVLIKPDGWESEPEALETHGITTELAMAEGIPEKEAIERLIEMRGDHRRMAFNKTFDQRIIRIGLKRYFDEDTMDKWHVKEDHDCSMRMAKAAMGVKSASLAEAHEHFTGDPIIGAHDAFSDTKACLNVYLNILGEPCATFE